MYNVTELTPNQAAQLLADLRSRRSAQSNDAPTVEIEPVSGASIQAFNDFMNFVTQEHQHEEGYCSTCDQINGEVEQDHANKEAVKEAESKFILLAQRNRGEAPKIHGIISSTRSTLDEKLKEVSGIFPGVIFTVSEFISTIVTPVKPEATISYTLPF